MKLFQKKSVWIMTSFILFIGYWVSCTKNDQVLQQGTTTSNGTTLVSLKVTSAPTIDGVIDPMWDNATKLNVVPQVPDPVSYTHLRAHETVLDLVCRLLL